jgi:hypothetical protein
MSWILGKFQKNSSKFFIKLFVFHKAKIFTKNCPKMQTFLNRPGFHHSSDEKKIFCSLSQEIQGNFCATFEKACNFQQFLP